jgi:hypothetical protein
MSAAFLLILTSSITIPIILENNASAFSFGSSENLSETGNGDSSVPQIVAKGESVYVVWEDDESGIDEIRFVKSIDSGDSFAIPVTISDPSTDSFDPQISTSEGAEEIYVVWWQDGEIYFSGSVDNGTSFGEPTNVSNSGNNSRIPQVAVSGENVYVAWEEDVTDSGTMDIYIASTARGESSFTSPVNLSNSSLQSSSAHLYAIDDTVYVVWKEFDSSAFVGDIYFSSRSDGDPTFGENVNISSVLGGDAFLPQLVADGTNIYVVWGDAINLDTFVVVSNNGGMNFGTPINLSQSGNVFNANPDISVSGDKVYFVWQDEVLGSADIFFALVTNGGGTIGAPVVVSDSDAAFSFNPRVAASETSPDTLYVVWQEDDPADVFLAVSTNGGTSFDDPVNISNTAGAGFSAFSKIAVAGDKLHVVWEDSSVDGQFDIFARTVADSGSPSITIDSVVGTSPRWDLDQVTISGTVNGNSTDIITIEWGDGTSVAGVEVSGSSWGPLSHTYDSAAVGPKEIGVKLMDEANGLKASASSEIEVQKHATGLSLDGISSVVNGTDIIVGGTLTDIDANVGIGGKEINFTGTGVTASLTGAVTANDGSYSSSGASPDIISDDPLTVQPHFGGDSAYAASDGNIVRYDTVASGTAEFPVTAGSPSGPIELTGFNASVSFDNVLSDGSVFVSECVSPSSSRYMEISDMCIRISPALELGEGLAHITLSYDGLSIPEGHIEGEIHLFHDGASGIVDITESIDTAEDTVTGGTTDFSRFIGGVALYTTAPIGAVGQPIFVGDNNDLVFEFPALRQVAFFDDELVIGVTHNVQVIDPYGNIDAGEIDSLNVTISSTSDQAGIAVQLVETNTDSGIFSGSFSLTTGSSSSSESKLKAAPSDEILASYEAPGLPPFRVIINGVAEAGIVEVSNFGMPSLFGGTRVDAFDVRLVEARLGPEAEVTVIMFYGNFTGVSDPLQLGMALSSRTECREVIGTSSLDDIDTLSKTITGYANEVGPFVLVLDDHIPADQECAALGFAPGGGGGGLPRPGTGVILLDTVTAIEDMSGGSGSGGSSRGGGSGSRSVGIAQTPTGNDVETTFSTGSGSVTIRFESVQADSGQLKVESKTLSAFEDIFEEITVFEQDYDEHGIVFLDGTTYSSTGDIFDIDTSAINFEGMIEVTIPYDENAVTSISGSESDVRFLHYDEEKGVWKDNTVSSDALANTVTGRLDSLSPVLAAVIIHQDIENINQLVVSDASFIISETTSEANLTMNLNNKRQTIQNYVIIAQVLDQKDVVQHIKWQERSIAGANEENVSMSWVQMQEGPYIVKVFIWTEMENPSMLSPVILPRMDV